LLRAVDLWHVSNHMKGFCYVLLGKFNGLVLTPQCAAFTYYSYVEIFASSCNEPVAFIGDEFLRRVVNDDDNQFSTSLFHDGEFRAMNVVACVE
jgi:hypothetical protein